MNSKLLRVLQLPVSVRLFSVSSAFGSGTRPAARAPDDVEQATPKPFSEMPGKGLIILVTG